MKSNQLLYIVFFILIILNSAYSQEEFGGHPRGQNWLQLKSEGVNIIFPTGMEKQASKIADIINYMDNNSRASIGEKRRRLEMVLQNRTTNPNGYVGLAPFRSEFYSTPPQSNLLLGSLDWLDALAIHEYRHAQQYLNGKRGLTNLLYWFSGQRGWQLGNIMTPNWFFEGDAVITETALTNSGRGRSAFFTMQQRALAYEGLNYSYHKHRNGSFKSMIPDQYRLGYMMLNHARNLKGNEITQKIQAKSSKEVGLFWGFSRAMKKYTDLNTKGMYNESWQAQKEIFQKQLAETVLIPTQKLSSKKTRTVTRYKYPYELPDGSILCSKSSYKEIDKLISIKNGKEKFIASIGANIDDHLTIGSKKIAWTEFSNNARRGHQDYSDVIIYSLVSNKKQRLTSKERFFSPAFSKDDSKLAAIQIDYNQNNKIVLLDPATGKIKQEINNPSDYFLSRIAWMENNEEIVTIAKKEGKLALMKVSLNDGSFSQLSPWTSHTMETPIVRGDYIYFNGSFGGIDNIFRIKTNGENQDIEQMTSVPVGSYEPSLSVDGRKIYFTEFSSKGTFISYQDISNENERSNNKISIQEPSEMPLYNSVAIKSEGGDILNKIEPQTYKIDKFKGLLKGQKLHSWGIEASTQSSNLSLSMVNLMNDVSINLSSRINYNESNKTGYNAVVSIGRFYPQWDFIVGSNDRSTNYFDPTRKDTSRILNFRELRLGAAVSLPLQWVKGNYNNRFVPRISFSNRNLGDLKTQLVDFDNKTVNTLESTLGFGTTRRTALQNLGTRLGYSVDAGYRTTLSKNRGKLEDAISARASIFLPGLGANHRLKITGNYLREDFSNFYQFSDDFAYARGYNSIGADIHNSVSIDYSMPLLYPDFGIPTLAFFKRLRTNLFYDWSAFGVIGRDTRFNFNSTGIELLMDTKILNIAEVGLGARIYKQFSREKKTGIEFILLTGF